MDLILYAYEAHALMVEFLEGNQQVGGQAQTAENSDDMTFPDFGGWRCHSARCGSRLRPRCDGTTFRILLKTRKARVGVAGASCDLMVDRPRRNFGGLGLHPLLPAQREKPVDLRDRRCRHELGQGDVLLPPTLHPASPNLGRLTRLLLSPCNEPASLKVRLINGLSSGARRDPLKSLPTLNVAFSK